MLVNNVPVLIGTALMAVAWDQYFFILGRIILGFACGKTVGGLCMNSPYFLFDLYSRILSLFSINLYKRVPGWNKKVLYIRVNFYSFQIYICISGGLEFFKLWN